jgi:hypothetical protein
VNQRYAISLATVVMLVVLRLGVGWHFFSEGIKHHLDPHWTSETVLRAAKGPLAPLYQAYLPEFHRFEELLHRDNSSSEEEVVGRWVTEIKKDWDDYAQQFGRHYSLNEAQVAEVAKTLRRQEERLDNWVEVNKDALTTHVHEWRRKQATRELPHGNLPYQKKRIADKQSTLAGESAGWHAELKGLESDYHVALGRMLDDDQRQRPLPHSRTSLELVDQSMKGLILATGVLLILGLFTRLACVLGAGFLLSVVMMQPFWVADTVPTFNQYVEMLVLLMLATTPVGRWAGLDFFLHNFLTSRKAQIKGTSDVSAT